MSICTFFGHHDAPNEINTFISSTIINLIKIYGVSDFLVGNNGNFDLMVIGCLKKLLAEYPYINVRIVLAYFPTKPKSYTFETIFPEGLELSPKKYAISKRNYWMLNEADHVITFVTRPCGGAAKFSSLAKQKGKNVINLSDFYST